MDTKKSCFIGLGGLGCDENGWTGLNIQKYLESKTDVCMYVSF